MTRLGNEGRENLEEIGMALMKIVIVNNYLKDIVDIYTIFIVKRADLSVLDENLIL
ncbi:hypothetical protein [Sulfolobus sp. S-194]|uniref:hypothetical protein n=1 Tax=Sulfolobus sp. S-194 TaxID=2512240 RepID=UPI001439C96C|nr:hypothetical protein [Sulfolobus sp. S-194]